MKDRYGFLSLIIIGAAALLGFFGTMMISVIGGLVYLGALIIGSYLILMSYCRKCPHSMNDTCKHYYPGRIAKKLPYKKTGKYTWLELSTVIVVVSLIFTMPLFYLINSIILFSVYLVLWILGTVMIRMKMCVTCYNRWCPMCPNRVKQ